MALGCHHIRDGTYQPNFSKTASMVRRLLHLPEKGPEALEALGESGMLWISPNSALTHCFPSDTREESLATIFRGQYPAREAAVYNDLWFCNTPHPTSVGHRTPFLRTMTRSGDGGRSPSPAPFHCLNTEGCPSSAGRKLSQRHAEPEGLGWATMLGPPTSWSCCHTAELTPNGVGFLCNACSSAVVPLSC